MELKWKDAIIKVLEEEKRTLHYAEIAELIAKRGYRTSLGATPQSTVNSNIVTDINKDRDKSIFVRIDNGIYGLKKILINDATLIVDDTTRDITGKQRAVNSFGIYWNRDLVHWKSSTPNLLGIQQTGAKSVDFKDQVGIYLLHDGRETIYVGQAIRQPLGVRLRDHTTDRLGGRWNRFSWFGFYSVNDNTELTKNTVFENLSLQDVANLLEAVLIESIEPRQNRKQGNLFSGVEYLQKESPEINRSKKAELLKEMSEKL